jgi:cyanophycinase
MISSMRRAAVAAFLLSLVVQATASAQGRLVVAGGGVSRDNAALYEAVLAGRHGAGPICVIPTASAGLDGARSSMNSSVATFERHGGAGAAVGLLMSTDNPEAAHDAGIVAQVRGCSGFYFTGGAQSRTVAVLRPDGEATPVLDALLARYRQGALVGGSSAGAAIMSDPMIAGGSPATALARGVARGGAGAGGDEGDDGADATPAGVRVTPGIGFLPGAIVDQHFLARGRIGRLIAAVLDLDEFDVGFGVDEDTGLVVDGRTVHAVGSSGVVIIDARHAVRDGRSARDVSLHLLGSGASYDMETGRLDVDAGMHALPRGSDAVGVPDNPFARWAFLHLLHDFARSQQQYVTVPFDGGEIVLRKGPAFTAVSSGSEGVEGTPADFTVRDVQLDVRRDPRDARDSRGARDARDAARE